MLKTHLDIKSRILLVHESFIAVFGSLRGCPSIKGMTLTDGKFYPPLSTNQSEAFAQRSNNDCVETTSRQINATVANKHMQQSQTTQIHQLRATVRLITHDNRTNIAKGESKRTKATFLGTRSNLPGNTQLVGTWLSRERALEKENVHGRGKSGNYDLFRSTINV